MPAGLQVGKWSDRAYTNAKIESRMTTRYLWWKWQCQQMKWNRLVAGRQQFWHGLRVAWPKSCYTKSFEWKAETVNHLIKHAFWYQFPDELPLARKDQLQWQILKVRILVQLEGMEISCSSLPTKFFLAITKNFEMQLHFKTSSSSNICTHKCHQWLIIYKLCYTIHVWFKNSQSYCKKRILLNFQGQKLKIDLHVHMHLKSRFWRLMVSINNWTSKWAKQK